MSGSGSESSGSSVRIRSNKNTHVIKIQIESESESLESTRLILKILNHESSQIQIYFKKNLESSQIKKIESQEHCN